MRRIQVHEILSHLKKGWVLDLGSRFGSFNAQSYPFNTVRVDLDPPAGVPTGWVVRGDAAELPFRDGSFSAIISNHSMEHFERLAESLREVGRTAGPNAALFVSVPDASTMTDRLYRWLARGGGHVNPFRSSDQLSTRIESATGLHHVATRPLFSSLSFLNKANFAAPPPRKMWLLMGGSERLLFAINWMNRTLDRMLGTRLAIYGWALYFGNISEPVSTVGLRNVCVRCGGGHPAASLEAQGAVARKWGLFRVYRCPVCDAANTFTPDSKTSAELL
jgi:SAM-dependent methyltransferase